jgi:hypothetical protein
MTRTNMQFFPGGSSMNAITAESTLADWAVQRACERLIVQYTHLIDSGQAGSIADLFVADGIWEAYRKRIVGQADLREAFHQRQKNTRRVSRHICSNISIDILGPREAVGRTYFTLFREELSSRKEFVPFSGPKMIGDYIDRFLLTEDGWKFAHRKVIVIFKIPGLRLVGELRKADAAAQTDDLSSES